MTAHTEHGTRPGRPRDTAADEAILTAAAELLTSGGVEATSMSAVVRRSGIARATVYRRYPNRQALVNAAIRRAIGFSAIEATGDLEEDLRRTGAEAQRTLARPAFRRLLPALVPALLEPPSAAGHLGFSSIAPVRRLVILAHAGRPGIDATLLVDTILGALIGRLLATGRPPTPEEADAIVELVVRGSRLRGAGGGERDGGR